MSARRHWIPPLPLVGGLLFQTLAWCLVLRDAVVPSFGIELAWVHAVALGWLTLVALAVLLHVIPGFTDLDWRGEDAARALVIVVGGGALALVISFASDTAAGVIAAAIALSLALVVYAALAIRTVSRPAPDARSAVIARGLTVTQLVLAVTAILGLLLAVGYARESRALLALGPSHAVLGIVGWLTLLTSGVSARTFRPLLGARSRWPAAHAIADSGLLLGAVVAALAAPWSFAGFRAGLIVGAGGALAYVVDAVDILRRATTPHGAARAFVAASVTWLALAVALTIALTVATSWSLLLGHAAIVVALAGWLGQMVNAHVHHLGVRVVSTFILGDDDETRPWTLLTPALSWGALATGQIAVAGTVARSLGAPGVVAWCAGIAGLLSVGCIVGNAVTVIRRAAAYVARKRTGSGGAGITSPS